MAGSRDQLLQWINDDREALVAFFSGFVRAKSPNPPGDTREAAAYLRRFLDERALPYRVVAPRAEMPNILGGFDGGCAGRHLVLNGHLDVFPAGDAWTREPWSGAVADGRVWGRGSADMKAGTTVAAMTYAYLHRLRDRLKGRLTLTAVSDEETGGRWGSGYLVENHPGDVLGDCLLSGEPSSLQTVRFGEKGSLRATITVRTPGAHGAYCHRSASATKIAARLVCDLDELERLTPSLRDGVARVLDRSSVRDAIDSGLGQGAAAVVSRLTVNVGVLRGGVKVNMLPGGCSLELDIRIPVGLRGTVVRDALREIVARTPEASLAINEDHSYEPTCSDPDGALLRIIQTTAGQIAGITPEPVVTLGGTDCRYWRDRGIPAYVYGVSPDRMGAPDESVAIDEFLTVLKCHVLSAYEYLSA